MLTGAGAIAVLAGPMLTTIPLLAQEKERTVTITGDRIGGFVLPVLPVESDIILSGLQSWTWKVDDTLRIQLLSVAT